MYEQYLNESLVGWEVFRIKQAKPNKFISEPYERFPGNEDFARQDLSGKDIRVTYILLNDPQRRLEGKLLDIQRAAELLQEEGVCYRLRIAVNKEDLREPRPGAEAISRVHCGKRALGFVLFHDAWEWAQKNLFF